MLGSFVILIGLILVVGSLILSSTGSGKGGTKGGAVILIGPIPIILGSDKRIASQLLVLSTILVLVLIVLYVLQIL